MLYSTTCQLVNVYDALQWSEQVSQLGMQAHANFLKKIKLGYLYTKIIGQTYKHLYLHKQDDLNMPILLDSMLTRKETWQQKLQESKIPHILNKTMHCPKYISN